jgi:hypothetical protein
VAQQHAMRAGDFALVAAWLKEQPAHDPRVLGGTEIAKTLVPGSRRFLAQASLPLWEIAPGRCPSAPGTESIISVASEPNSAVRPGAGGPYSTMPCHPE